MEPTQQPIQPVQANSPNIPTTGNKKNKTTMILIALGALLVIVAGILAYVLLAGLANQPNAEEPVNTVTIKQDGFLPTTIKIKKGQEVAWVNEDENIHQVFADQQAAPSLNSNGPLTKGDTYIYKFEQEGTVNYYDPQDPNKFKGTVIVE